MTSQAELSEISASLHDEYFDIDRLDYDVERREVRLPIFRGRWRKGLFWWTGRPPEASTPPFCALVVRGVEEVIVNDDAEIGLYDIGSVEYDDESHVVRIRSNVPCEIIARCTRLDVERIDA
ncbi:MAG TPA: hypothetical protein VJM33_15475 [Microthrixaceae bacterium]|nr:hypothetical protein [Microthrixaceae bacterium]